MSSNIFALALDFDGVIVDSMPRQEMAWRQALKRTTPKVSEIAVMQLIKNLWAGHSGVRMFNDVELTQSQREFARKEKDLVWAVCRRDARVMNGAVTVLDRLSRKVPIFIATSAPRAYVEDMLEREALTNKFHHIVTDQDVCKPKPAPDMLEKIAGYISSTPSHVLLIGDTYTDFEMAKAAGSQFLLLDIHSKFSRCDLNVHKAKNWEEVESFVCASLQ